MPIHDQGSGAAAAGPVAAVTVPDIDHHVLTLGSTVKQLFPEVALELGTLHNLLLSNSCVKSPAQCLGSLVCSKDNCVGDSFESTGDCCMPSNDEGNECV